VARAREAGYIDYYQEQYYHDRILQFRAASELHVERKRERRYYVSFFAFVSFSPSHYCETAR